MKKILFTDLDGTLLNDEKLVSEGNRAAIERLRHTARVINDYLCGKILEIEELEPELIQGEKTKWLGANDFMYIHTM